MPQAVQLIDLTPSSEHCSEIDALRRTIDWGPGSWFLGPMMEAGGRVLGARGEDGALIAMGGGAVFPPSGFICNMVVRPDQKRRGLGRQIFEELIGWLRSSGFASIQLEATAEGRPLYEQYGFHERWESVGSTLVTPPGRGDESRIESAGAAGWDAVAELDLRATGMARGALLRRLAAQPNFREAVVLRSAAGVDGYGLRFDGRIGPLVATTPSAAATLARALASRSEPGTIATVGHPRHAELWASLGFDVSPFDLRMFSGPEPADDTGMIFCMLNGGAG